MKLKEWGLFALLGLVWGSSFLWIKVGLGGELPRLGLVHPAGATTFQPFMLVAFRLLFGLLGLLGVMLVQRPALPRDRRTLLAYLVMALFNTALPFVLITWGERSIDSGLASILNGTVPLFTIVIAHFWQADERMTLGRLGGLLIGFVGLVLLVSDDLSAQALTGNLLGQLAVLAASVSYAFAINFSRKYLRNQSPVVQSFMVLLLADGLLWLALPAAEPLTLPTSPLAWLAVLWLGVLGSCLAYLLFFSLVNAWGPTRTSLVTYVFPVIGLALGITLLGETADWRLLAGSALVVAGVLVVNGRALWRAMTAPATPAAAPAKTR